MPLPPLVPLPDCCDPKPPTHAMLDGIVLCAEAMNTRADAHEYIRRMKRVAVMAEGLRTMPCWPFIIDSLIGFYIKECPREFRIDNTPQVRTTLEFFVGITSAPKIDVAQILVDG